MSKVVKSVVEQSHISRLFSNYQYIDWLVKFTANHPILVDTSLKYYSGAEDERVSELKYFAKGVICYFIENMIETSKDSIGQEWYVIKYKGIAFGFRMENNIYFVGRDVPFYANVTFSDILLKDKGQDIALKQRRLELIRSSLLKAKKIGVPKRELLQMIDEIFN